MWLQNTDFDMQLKISSAALLMFKFCHTVDQFKTEHGVLFFITQQHPKNNALS